VPSDFKENPHTITSDAPVFPENDEHGFPPPGNNKKGKSGRRLHEAQAEGVYLWDSAKHYLLRPGVAGGLIGLLNIGLVAGVGRAFYTRPNLRRDAAAVSSVVTAAIALVTVEGYAAESYRKTTRGQEEERRAKEEGAVIYRHLREVVLRPGVLGGLVGFVNTVVLGAVGYLSYKNWERPTWDRRAVTAVTIGLLSLWGGEGYLAERYRKETRRV